MSATSRFLTGLLAGAGALHLVAPEPFDTIVPAELPGSARAWTVWSGLAEIGVAGLLAHPASRRWGGGAAAALFVAVFPGNLEMARQWSDRAPWQRALAYGRLPLQGVLVAQAVSVAREPRT